MWNFISNVMSNFYPNTSGSLSEVKKPAYINKLPNAVEAKIFSYLKPSDLGNISAVDKRRNEAVSTSGEKTPSLKDRAVYRDFAFNSKDWKTYCKKDVDKEGEMSSFPPNIWKELNKPCKVFPGARIGQTHMLAWIPKTMNGEPLTLNSFGRVLKQHFPDNSKGYRCMWDPILTDPVVEGVTKSGWVFMTVDVIPGSRGKSYPVQEGLVTNLDRGNLYKVPKAVQVVVCISARFFKSGERRFSDEPRTYTRCQEQVQGYLVVVGGFAAAGLQVVNFYDFDNDSFGVGALFGP